MQNFGSEDISEENYVFIAQKIVAKNILFLFPSLFPPLCSYIPLHLHLGQAFLGL